MTKKLDTYSWKEKRDGVGKDALQQEFKMMDMSEKELNKAYNHCKNMLYNNSKVDPGRFLVLKKISDQLNNCTAELAIRWFCGLLDHKDQPKYSRFSLLIEIKEILERIRPNYPEDHIFRLQDIYSGIPTDFNPVSIDSIIKSCKDTLGKFHAKYLTKHFIIKQGIWFTSEELKSFQEIEKLKTPDEIIKLIKNRMGLSYATELRLKPSGLTYNQFRGMMSLRHDKKYSELTTIQLETLKNKILFNLEEQVLFHINTWQDLMTKIEEVCEYRKIKLV